MSETMQNPPLVSTKIPGFEKPQAQVKSCPEDFLVDELPRESRSDDRSHMRFRVEKRGLTTEEALFSIAKTLGIDKESIGSAGLKDKQAVTTQYLSVPHRYENALPEIEIEGLKLLEVCGHGPKLKRGELDGNVFSIFLRGVDADTQKSLCDALSYLETNGVPNAYGAQRFGHQWSTWEMGKLLLEDGEEALANLPRQQKRFMRRLALNAVQSGIFNAWLMQRQEDNLLQTLIYGDVIWVERLGTAQLVLDPEAEQKRLEAGKVSLTGPMFGIKMRAAVGKASPREKSILAQSGFTLKQFAAFSKVAPGSRRSAVIYPKQVSCQIESEGVRVAFTLPSGAYATVVLDALVQESLG
jgi:tRNA pseudouridine13 synthase